MPASSSAASMQSSHPKCENQAEIRSISPCRRTKRIQRQHEQKVYAQRDFCRDAILLINERGLTFVK